MGNTLDPNRRVPAPTTGDASAATNDVTPGAPQDPPTPTAPKASGAESLPEAPGDVGDARDAYETSSTRSDPTALSQEIDLHLRRPGDPLRRGGLFNPRYSMGSIFRPITTGPGMTHDFGRPSYTDSFSSTELSDIGRTLGNSNATAADVDRIAGYLNTPDRVAAFLGESFTWQDTHSRATETYSPLSMLQNPVGICRDQHQFATYVLRQNGYEANTVGYGAPGVHHAITTFRDENGWGIVEYGRVHNLGAATEAEALATVIPGALKFWIYDDVDSPTSQPGIPARVIETHAGLELKRFMHLGDGYLHTALSPLGGGAPGDQWRARISSGTASTTATTGVGDFELDLRAWHGEDPMLSRAFGAAVRYRSSENVGFSLGVTSLPEAYSYSIGPRRREEHPLTVAFLGMDGNWDLFDRNLTDDGRLHFNSNLDARLALAVGFVDGGVDVGVTAALSHADLTWRNELSWQATENLRLWGAGSAYLPMGDIASYYMTGGDALGAPVTMFGEVGADVSAGNFTGGVSLYAPIQTHTNLFADEPRWQLTGAYHLGADADIIAGTSSGFSSDSMRSAYAGVRYGALTVTGGVQDSFMGRRDAYVSATVDVLRLFRRNGR